MTRSFLTQAFLSLALGATALATTAKAEESYVCKKTLFGCTWEYTGTTTQEDAQKYLADAEAFTGWIEETIEGVESTHLRLSRGDLVVGMEFPHNIDNHELQAIKDKSREMNVWVDIVHVTDQNHNRLLRISEVKRNMRPYSRFYALNDIEVEVDRLDDEEQIEKVADAFPAIRRHVNGNVYIDLR